MVISIKNYRKAGTRSAGTRIIKWDAHSRKAKRHEGHKGYIYTLEVLIALSMMLVTIFMVMRAPPNKPETETSLIKRIGFDSVEYLHLRNRLREWADADNESRIESELASILPKNIFAEAEICTSPCDDTNVPENQTVIGIDYYVAGYKDVYSGKKVKVWLWRKF